MKKGVNIKIKDNEPKRIPNPIRNMNKPSNIGFLICAYKPAVINFGGGLKGTGVPLVRINASAVQPQTNQPRLRKKIDKTIVHQEESKRKKTYNLSTQIEAKTKRTTKPKNNIATGSVCM